ncbi:MAG TPA: hypothetical protein VFE19_11105 [Jatrophihabitantaceae bacterium]|nr:hypothetical protein [Jatrophihabitantaceae bacterium]
MVGLFCVLAAVIALAAVVDGRDRARERKLRHVHEMLRARLWERTQAAALRKATIVFPVGWVAPDRSVPANRIKQPS